jgi:uncharacterized cupin superfamily protein
VKKVRPNFIANYKDLIDSEPSHYKGSTEALSLGSSVGKKLGLTKIGIHIETLAPGTRTSWPHAESLEEEFGHVIKGHPDVWIDGHLYNLVPGDFVAFPAGTGIAHTFINNSDEDCLLLVGGESTKAENKIFYPLNLERNLQMQTEGCFWENHPIHELGPHDGLPDKLRNLQK